MEDRKETLKRIAMETAQRTGIQSVTVRDLGAAVGIKSSSVMYHFESKQGLIHEIAEDYIDAVQERLREIKATETSAKGRVLGVVAMFEDLLQQDRMCLCGRLTAEQHELDEPTQGMVRRLFDQMESWLAGVLREQESAQISARAARRDARMIVSSLEGALLLDRGDGTSKRLSAVRAWVDEYVDD